MNDILKSAEVIKKFGVTPKVGMVLGSGLGPFADEIEDAQFISYKDLPGFPETGVMGHAGQLILGTVKGVSVAVMQGRAHYYEKGDAAVMKVPVRVLKEIGCETLILTNAAGSTNADAGPGSVMMLTDHISFTGVSPLFGEADMSRFVDLVDAYDPAICQALRAVAKDKAIDLFEGVYMWFCGPHFETPAEIRAAKILGASAVGMSTVPEVIMARQIGMKVAAISIITNMAAGLSSESLSHAHTMANADKATEKILALLTGYFESISK